MDMVRSRGAGVRGLGWRDLVQGEALQQREGVFPQELRAHLDTSVTLELTSSF